MSPSSRLLTPDTGAPPALQKARVDRRIDRAGRGRRDAHAHAVAREGVEQRERRGRGAAAARANEEKQRASADARRIANRIGVTVGIYVTSAVHGFFPRSSILLSEYLNHSNS
jgi:hypothetical protein